MTPALSNPIRRRRLRRGPVASPPVYIRNPDVWRSRLTMVTLAVVLYATLAGAALAGPQASEARSSQSKGTVAAKEPPITPEPDERIRPDLLSLTLSARRDTTAPHTTKASGRLIATNAEPRAACSGTINLVGTAGGRTVIAQPAKLVRRHGACTYATKVTLRAADRGRARTLRIVATFGGNDVLLPATSSPRTLELE